MIELKNIDVTFQNGSHEFKAVDNVSLKINKGEIFGIVGPSGAGKSTLVRVINLLQRPTNGEVIIEGVDTNVDYQFEIMNDPDYQNGAFDIGFLESHEIGGVKVNEA